MVHFIPEHCSGPFLAGVAEQGSERFVTLAAGLAAC
jgi:hypothetical protein